MNFIRQMSERVRMLGQSFQAKLTFMLLLPLMVIWTSIFLTSATMLERQHHFVGDQQVSATKLQADELNEKIKNLLAILEAIAASMDLADLTGTQNATDYLSQRYALKPMFPAGTVIYDRSGTALGDYPVAAGRKGSNFADREYLQRVYATGKSSVSQPFMGRFLNVMQISMCVPIVGADRQVNGALCGNLDMQATNFFGRLSAPQYMGNNGFFLISTRDRVLIASTDGSRVMSQLPDNPLVQQLMAGSGKAFVAKNIAGVEKLYASAPVVSAGWALALGLPTDIAYAPVRTTVGELKRDALLATLLVILAAFFFAQRMLRPLQQAGLKMDAMSSGREPLQRVEETGDNEVHRLLTSFNRLSDSMSSQQTQLQSERNALLLAKSELSHLNQELEARVMGAAADFTALKNAEQRVKQARNELLGIFDNLAEAVFVFDKHGKILRINRVGRSMHGLFDPSTPPAEVMAQIEILQPNGEVMSPEQWPSRRGLRGDFVTDLELQVRRKDTRTFVCKEDSSVPIFDESGELLMYVVTSRDITERKRHENLLRESELNLRQSHADLEQRVKERTSDLLTVNRKLAETQFAMDSVGIGIHWVDADSGRFIQVNKIAAEMLGYSDEEMLSLRVSDIDPNFPEESLLQALGDFRQQGTAHFDSSNRTKEGRTIPVDLTLYFLPEVADEPPRFIVFVTDISKRKDAELALIHARKLADAANLAKTNFLANMSHEIRSPLNGILGMAYLLEQSKLDHDSHSMVRNIRASGRALLSLINDILDMSKIEAGQMMIEQAPFRLGDVMDNVAVALGVAVGEKDIELVISPLPIGVSNTVGDALRLEQVLINLISNAAKFTQTGSIQVLAEVLSGVNTLSILRFCVKDTGVGIAPELQNGIFSAFAQADTSTTRRFGGTGLGLTICRQLVSLMGGEIGVISTPGEGSEFWFTVPLLQAEGPNYSPANMIAVSVLIADDSDIALRAIADTAKGLGWKVSAVDCGAAALAHVRECKQGQLPDVVVLDWQMPGLDGLAAARLIREGVAPDECPIVIMATAHSLTGLAAQPGAALVDAILHKPVTSSGLYNAVMETQNRRAATAKVLPVAMQATSDSLAGLRVLVVDDSDINRDVARRILVGEGAVVTLAEDGQQAIDWLLAHAGEVDIVLMDVQMPVLDGMETTRRLRRMPKFAGLPIVALTAGAFKSQQDAAMAAGMTHFVSKPFDIPSTIALIQLLCRPLQLAQATQPSPIVRADSSATVQVMDVAQGLNLWTDTQTYQSYLRRFANDYCDVGVQIQTCLSRGERESAASLAHKLSGVAANLALPDTRSAAQALEQVLGTQNDPALTLTLLSESLAATVAEINRYASPATDANEVPNTATQDLQTLTSEQQQALKPLLVLLLAALDTDNATPVKKCLAVMSHHLPPEALTAIWASVLGYDFRGAEAQTRQLASYYKADLGT
ncbi:MAG: response regulator [Rhodoferax sp.]|uniref:response regulator n=1 Tax=Rhodoferax sp. TaxID=50421 RepID=UPI0026231DB4|nr:response regulator [Rhodoferax sp.]MDD2879342.1 response regulator [Rhodoferax sp.]